jgi:hypothetical protein
MRLLHTAELRIQEFAPNDIPKYAILSHVWGKGEVTFQDIGAQTFAQMDGFPKLEACCKKAVEDEYEWVWVDACCIDKSSSAELSEAINSMYRWYQDAAICYAYLVDVQSIADLKESRWFSRGWTLQELIAPQRLTLLDGQWRKLGTKKSLIEEICRITGIPKKILSGTSPIQCNIAQRMSWAASRQTTREEDIAYSLMGLFDVHMAPIYGEGAERAFIRLQEEILKRSSDQTLFLWTPSHDRYNQGLLATSPSAFCTHENCFSWLTGPLRVLTFFGPPKDEHLPYSLLRPTSNRLSSVNYQNSGSRSYGVGHPEDQPSSFGSYGLEISLLASSDYPSRVYVENYQPLKVALDVEATYSSNHYVVFISLRTELQVDSTRGFIPNRLGTLRREFCTDADSVPQIGHHLGSLRRQRLTVSQINDPGCGQPAHFKFVNREKDFSFRELLVFGPKDSTKVLTTFTESFTCEGGCLILKHGCATCNESTPMQLMFGTRGRRCSEAWCIFLPSVRSLQPSDFTTVSLKNAYSAWELLKGRLFETFTCLMPCNLRACVEIEHEEERNVYLINVTAKKN